MLNVISFRHKSDMNLSDLEYYSDLLYYFIYEPVLPNQRVA